MKRFHLIVIITLFLIKNDAAQGQEKAYSGGEWLKYRLSYSNFIGAGTATLEVKDRKNSHHIIAKGKSTGIVNWFFKVKDTYQTFIDKQTGLPNHFYRKINEGGYKKDVEIIFNHSKKKATVINNENKKKQIFSIFEDSQDMLSTLYYLRNTQINTSKIGSETVIKMFLDNENYTFKLRFIGKELIKTKIGKVKALKFRPIVQAGRVFKENESVTFWISDDKNKIPLKIKADLSVGSLNADLQHYKGLSHPLKIYYK